MRNYRIIFIFLTISIFITSPALSQDYRSAEEAEGIKAGSPAPAFTATSMQGNDFSLQKALDNGPVVMIFYRGHWCPVCNRHLKAIQDSIYLVEQHGATLIAVSPERVPLLGRTAEKTGAEFTLLHDEDFRIAKAYDVHFLPGEEDRIMYNTVLGARLEQAHSDDSQQLPIPATYIIDENGTIVWRHFNPDHRIRASMEDIVNVLEEL